MTSKTCALMGILEEALTGRMHRWQLRVLTCSCLAFGWLISLDRQTAGSPEPLQFVHCATMSYGAAADMLSHVLL